MSKDTMTGGDGRPADKEQKEDEFIAVELDEKGQPVEVTDKDDSNVDDPDDSSIDDPDDEEEERLGHDESGEEGDDLAGETIEEKRERRRRENKAKRIRNRTAAAAKDRLIENQGRMLLNLQEQVAGLQGRSIRYDVNLLQDQLGQIEAQQTDAKAVLAKLVKAGDGEGVAEVTELQMNLRDQHRNTGEQLKRAKAAISKNGSKPVDDPDGDGQSSERRPPQRRPDSRVVKRAEAWAANNKWFNPQQGGEEAEIVKAIDHNLHQEGWDPAVDDYWDELSLRVKRRLPHRFKKAAPNGAGNNGSRRVSDDNGSNKRLAQGGPRMAAASQSGGRVLGKNEVIVTPLRKKAMQDAGKWDDPVLRNKQLAAYAKYDRDNADQQ